MTQLTLPGIEPPRLNHRLFFAVKPDPDTAARIADAAHRLRPDATHTKRRVDTVRLHMTLHSLGDFMYVPQDVVVGACHAAQRVHAQPFDVTFDRIVSFKGRPGNYPWVLTASDAPRKLLELQQQLVEALKRTGLRASGTLSTPHVTLRYDERRRAPRTVEPITWTVSEFVLIDSGLRRTRHDVIGCWRLNADAPA